MTSKRTLARARQTPKAKPTTIDQSTVEAITANNEDPQCFGALTWLIDALRRNETYGSTMLFIGASKSVGLTAAVGASRFQCDLGQLFRSTRR
jgi:hypothetical protein